MDVFERGRAFFGAVEARAGWLGPAAARFTVGWVFLESGWGKLHNLEQVAGFFASLGIPAPQLQAPFVAAVEFVGGALLLGGLATRFAAVPLIGVMVVALSTALADQIEGLSDLLGLSELCYAVMLAWLALRGAGSFSLDALIARRMSAK